MKILLTNDDGINAPGLRALLEVAQEFGDALVVAPHIERSAVGHAITLSDPLRVERVILEDAFLGYAVSGTPADCVKIAFKSLMNEKPDLVISGINQGSNVGTSVIYSGTVSAATEAIILGVPAIAISLDATADFDFTLAQQFLRHLLATLDLTNFPKDTALNINIPAVAEKDCLGVEITYQGKFRYEEQFDRRRDPQQREYFWLTGQVKANGDDFGSDSFAIASKKISITPIHYDLTHHQVKAKLDKILGDAFWKGTSSTAQGLDGKRTNQRKIQPVWSWESYLRLANVVLIVSILISLAVFAALFIWKSNNTVEPTKILPANNYSLNENASSGKTSTENISLPGQIPLQ